MNVLGVILARSGSEGLANKHLLPLLSRPVISYTIGHARRAALLSQVVVSSDCPEVLALGARAGFVPIHRPAELATADASVQDVLLHALETVESAKTFRADGVVVLYGNVPVRGEGVIDRAIAMLEDTGCDSVRSFCPVGKWHPSWMSTLEGDRVIANEPGSLHRRQDLRPLLLHDGAVVAASRDAMLRARANRQDPHAFFGTDRRGFLTQPGDTVEIDHLRDLYFAEAILREKSSAQRSATGRAETLRAAG